MTGSRSRARPRARSPAASYGRSGGARGDGAAARMTSLRIPVGPPSTPADRLSGRSASTRRSTTEQPLRPLPHAPWPSASSWPTAPWARCSRRPTPRWTTSRATRAATRSSTSPGPTSSARVHDAYFEVGRRLRRDEHLRRQPGQPRRVRHRRPDPRARRRPARRIAREAADAWSTAEQPRFVLGSVGPGTKLPTLGHAPYATLRDAYAEQVARHDRRRRRRGAGRDRAGPAAGQGRGGRREAGAGRRRRRPAGDGPGDGRDDRHDAARHARSAPR